MLKAAITLYISSYMISDTAKIINLTQYFISNARSCFFDTYRFGDSEVYLVVYLPIVEKFLLSVKLNKLLLKWHKFVLTH